MARRRLRLAQRRRALGYTQEDLAARIGCERTTVIRWERAQTEPQPWLRPKLCQVLRLTPEELQAILTDVAELPDGGGGIALVSTVPLDFSLPAAYTVRFMEGFSAHDIASRREALASLAVLSGTALVQPIRQWAGALTHPPRTPLATGTEEISELEQAVTLFRRWDDSLAGGLRRKAVVGQLNAVAESLHSPHPPPIKQRLFQVTAELAHLAGWMAYDQGLFGTAQRYYLLGLHACRENGSQELGAKIVGDMAKLSTTLGHYEDSLSLVQTALYSLSRHASSLVRAELLGLEAGARAHLGDRESRQAARVAGTSVAVYEEAPPEPSLDWLQYLNLAEVDGAATNAYTELALQAGEPGQWRYYARLAELHCLRARSSRGERYLRSRILDEIRLAKVRLAQREPAEAAAVGLRALQLADDTRSSLIVDRLMSFSHLLRERYPDLPGTASVHERLRHYVSKAAPVRAAELS
jgi:DNA-binding XRE family transcriptional regulator